MPPNKEISSNKFYDSIASGYDAKMNEDPGNERVRNIVKRIALEYLDTNQLAMDFGGGTGLDVPWLSENSKTVYFCEPSEKMLEIAIDRIRQHKFENVVLLNHTDFRKFDTEDLNIKKGSLDFVLSNFAVFNSIYELNELFKHLSMLIRPNGILLVTVLSVFPGKKMRLNLLNRITDFVRFNFTSRSWVLKEREGHVTIVHTDKMMRSEAKKHFVLIKKESIKHSMFTLYTFRRK